MATAYIEAMQTVQPRGPYRLISFCLGGYTAWEMTQLKPSESREVATLDVTYDSLLERQRKERHLLVGEAIEELYHDRLDEYCDSLARHFAGAQDWDRAVSYGLLGARRAASLWRIAEAVSGFERTRSWVQRREMGDDERAALTVELLLEEERHLETLGRRERQQELIDEIMTLLPPGPSPARATALVRQGELATLRGNDEAAAVALREAIEVATEADAHQERIMAVRGIGHAYWRRGMYEQALGPLEEVV